MKDLKERMRRKLRAELEEREELSEEEIGRLIDELIFTEGNREHLTLRQKEDL